jgi:F-type H+-transporting ATPase subunit b
MSVDWFTVAAQIINFLILIWLLKKFLYKPILRAMDNRQKKVKAKLEQAATLAISAETEKKQYLTLQKEVREREKKELRQAQQDADDLRKKLFQEVKAEADDAHVSWQKELAREKVLFSQQASDQVAAQFHHLAQRVFQDLADENFEERIIAHFCTLIANHDTEQEFFGQLQNNAALKVFSAFSLADSSQEMIKQALQLRLAVQPEIHFLQEPKLLGGILLSSDNHKLEWNIHHYLADFQSQLENTLFKDTN